MGETNMVTTVKFGKVIKTNVCFAPGEAGVRGESFS
jgi:hypothetical protein